ncbi:MAG: c-type cytochrome [Thermodesulfobacteriota bacterium]
MHLLKVVIFGLVIIGFYTFFGVEYFPKVALEGPPEEASTYTDGGMEGDIVALGESVFKGKGACTLCHMPSGRAEVLDRVFLSAPRRLRDSRYKGSAKSALEYVFESMLSPSAYVVKGLGVVGSGDTLSAMPDVRSAQIGLSDAEIRAVAAYLQSLSGVEVTVTPDTPITYGRGARSAQ